MSVVGVCSILAASSAHSITRIGRENTTLLGRYWLPRSSGSKVFSSLKQDLFFGAESMPQTKAHTEYLTFNTRERYEMVHITPQVEEIVRRSGIDDGLCFVSPMHITAAIYVNDHEDGLIEDIGAWLEKLAPRWPGYKHHRTGEDNADAHLKALLLHHETTLPVTRGRLDLGTWQRIFYAEFDGQRSKRVIVKLLGLAKE
jgi:secondary thiamine-phosphate synthase enzyme